MTFSAIIDARRNPPARNIGADWSRNMQLVTRNTGSAPGLISPA
jgi:hypothetical protein